MQSLVTAAQLAKHLGCTRQNVNYLRARGIIKGYRFVRDFRYDLSEVLAALRKRGNSVVARTARAKSARRKKTKGATK